DEGLVPGGVLEGALPGGHLELDDRLLPEANAGREAQGEQAAQRTCHGQSPSLQSRRFDGECLVVATKLHAASPPLAGRPRPAAAAAPRAEKSRETESAAAACCSARGGVLPSFLPVCRLLDGQLRRCGGDRPLLPLDIAQQRPPGRTVSVTSAVLGPS